MLGSATSKGGTNNMNRIFGLLIASLIAVFVARAADANIEVYMTSTPGGEEETSFAADTPSLFAMFNTKGIKDGDKVRGVLSQKTLAMSRQQTRRS